MSNRKRHELFKKDLIESEERRHYTAKMYRSLGYYVVAPPLRVAPTFEEHEEYADDGDLWVENRLVEVRHLKCDFTVDYWPFGKAFIVDQANTFDKKKVKPYIYIVWNRKKTCFGRFWVERDRGTMRREKRLKKDPVLGTYPQEYYITSIENVRFFNDPFDHSKGEPGD